jgi:RluA family pseudouridine synthase
VTLPIVFVDDHVVVIDKPVGMLVHPVTHTPEGSAIDLLTAQIGGPLWLAHRLDRGTSGLLLFARTAPAHRVLTRHFAERRVEKAYVAVIHGLLDGPREVDAPIGRGDAGGWCVRDDGRSATSTITPVETAEGRTRVSLVPHTGRTHQLRLHCAHLGYPIVGDRTYGSDVDGRVHLHAARLGFWHPAGLGWMVVERDAPEGFSWAC